MTKAARGAAAQPLDREFIRKVNRALLAWYAATARPTNDATIASDAND